MITRYIIPGVAAFGIFFALIFVYFTNKQQPPGEPPFEPARAPYKSFIYGAGLVEPNSRVIQIGVAVSGVVEKMNVTTGDIVKKDDILFVVDTRTALEDVKVSEAALVQAQVNFLNAQDRYTRANSIEDKRAISVDDLNSLYFNFLLTKAQMISAEVDLERAKEILELHNIRAPFDGCVFELNIHLGEYAYAGINPTPLIKFGNINPYNIRTDIDETDIWRFRPNTNAMAYVRGNPKFNAQLKFEQIETYVEPKESLTGASTERVDTRVLQVLYSFDPALISVFMGQQMDVYIETPINE